MNLKFQSLSNSKINNLINTSIHAVNENTVIAIKESDFINIIIPFIEVGKKHLKALNEKHQRQIKLLLKQTSTFKHL